MSVMIAAFMRGVTRLNDFIGRWVALLIFAMFVFLLPLVFVMRLPSHAASY